MSGARQLESAVSFLADAAWRVLQSANRHLPSKSFQPAWAPAPLQKSWERSSPVLGWPRTTDSLCPTCVRDARTRILSGDLDVERIANDHTGEIKAQILERDGKIVIEKTCPKHGTFTDVLAINPQFLQRIESLFPGRDFRAVTDKLHNHGSSSIKYGRGSVLTVDLTNRCNMMCDPCFMDANQVGYVHELTLDEVKVILDDALSIKPRRQLTVQFSGGEPTISPHFLEAVAYARQIGYYSAQAATNGIRFAQDPEFAMAAAAAGLRIAYLQFDGIGEDANSHRKVGNLFDVKLRAIENLYRAGIDIALVVTIVRTINDDQVGPIIRFAVENCDKISFVSFQPVSFTGRDEDIDDETRAQRRYTLSHLAEDVKRQTGATEPLRDWFPLSAASAISDVADLVNGPAEHWGTMKCGCHPNCGTGTALLVSKTTKQWAALGDVMNVDRFFRDARQIADAGRGPLLTRIQAGLSLLRNYRPSRAPHGFRLIDLIKKFDKQSGGALGGVGAPPGGNRKADEWLILFIAGMWFQDLWTYDFRRTEMCIIPYATQMGEISFCAYNTGVGWRHIVEKIHQNATVAEWYKEHGRHAVYANPRKAVPLEPLAQPVALTIPKDGRLVPLVPKRKASPAPADPDLIPGVAAQVETA
jgi:7,8-dihydro-6-hydroxymethylpterin dimethyltransferase